MHGAPVKLRLTTKHVASDFATLPSARQAPKLPYSFFFAVAGGDQVEMDSKLELDPPFLLSSLRAVVPSVNEEY